LQKRKGQNPWKTYKSWKRKTEGDGSMAAKGNGPQLIKKIPLLGVLKINHCLNPNKKPIKT